MISSEFYHKHLADKVDGLGAVGTFIRLVGANDLEIPIAGYLEIPIEICGFSVRASFLVRSDAPSEPLSERRVQFPVLLGCNIFRAIASIGVVPVGPCRDDWNVALQWFKCRDKQDQCTHRPFKPTRGAVGEVCLVQEETISPFSVRYVSVSCKFNKSCVTLQHKPCAFIRNHPLVSGRDESFDFCKHVHVLEGVQDLHNICLSLFWFAILGTVLLYSPHPTASQMHWKPHRERKFISSPVIL